MASIDNKKKAAGDWVAEAAAKSKAQILASGDWVKKAAEVSRAQAKPSPLDGKPAADWIKEAAAVARKEWAKGPEGTKWLYPTRELEYMVPPRPDAIGKIIERNRAAAAGRRSFSDYLKDTAVGRFSNLLVGAGKSTLSSLMNSLGMLTEDRGIGDWDSYPTDVDLHTPVENKIIEAMEDISRRSYQAADKVSASAGQDFARAKEGLGKAGNVVADSVVGIAQLGGDILMAQATGGSALVPMAARAFGGSGQEARLEGATPDQQLLYGVGSAAVAVFAEKISNFAPLLAKAFGKGISDQAVKKAIQKAAEKMAASATGRAAITKLLGIVSSAVGEGLEEVFEATVDPLLRRATFDKEADWVLEDILYEGLIGAIIGGIAGIPGQLASSAVDAEAAAESAVNDPAKAAAQADTDLAVQQQSQQQSPAAAPEQAPEAPVSPQDGLQPPEGITTPPQAETPQGDAQPAQQPTSAQNSLEVKLPTEAQNAPQGIVEPATANVPLKERQAKIITDSNPMTDGYHVGIRNSNDIKTFVETLGDSESFVYGDFSQNDAQNALSAGEVTVYSSKPIGEVGEFVSTSKNMAQDYAGNGQVFEKTIPLEHVAWINGDEGQYSGDVNVIEASEKSVKPANTIFPENSLGSKLTQQLPQGLGAMSPQFAYQEAPAGEVAPTQSKLYDVEFTPEEKAARPDLDNTHEVRGDAFVDSEVRRRFDSDYEGEKQDLFFNRRRWNDADTKLASEIIKSEADIARQSGSADAWAHVAELQKVYAEHGTDWGQVGRQRQRVGTDPATAVSEAAAILFDEEETAVRKSVRKDREATAAAEKLFGLTLENSTLPQGKAAELMRSIYDYSKALETIPEGDTGSLINLIRDIARLRRTTGLFSRDTSAIMNRALEYVANNIEGGEGYLRAIAAAQIRNIAVDYKAPQPMNMLKSAAKMSMLSKFTTPARNLTGNTTFGELETGASNAVVLLDMLMSKLTGTRSIPFDRGSFSLGKWRGSLDGAVLSYLQVALDADALDSQSKYQVGSTFKMVGGPAERFMACLAKWQSYLLVVPDEFAKGGIRAEAQRGAADLYRRGKAEPGALDFLADRRALERTFQNESMPEQVTRGAQGLGNRLFSFKDKRGGSFGVGDMAIPFPGVPANIAGQVANYSPIGLVKSIKDTVQFVGKVIDAKKAQAEGKGDFSKTITAEEQNRILTQLGRGLAGAGVAALMAVLYLKGVIVLGMEDDKDKAALDRSEGMIGIGLNLSALRRIFGTTESRRPQDGDLLMGFGGAEALEFLALYGSLVAESLAEGRSVPASLAAGSLESLSEAIMEMPGMWPMKEFLDSIKFSERETGLGKALEAAGRFAGSTAGSFIPNIMAGAASAMDGTVRDSYSGEWYERAVRGIQSRIPVLREKLPASLDPFGEEREYYGGNQLLTWLNQNLLPGAVTRYSQTEVSKELQRLRDAGVDVKYPERRAPKVVGGKELTDDERYIYQQTQGQLYYRLMDTAREAPAWGALSDEEKGRMTKAISSFARGTAKMKVMSVRDDELDEKWEALSRMDDGQVVQYLAQKEAFTTMRDSLGFNAKSFMAFADEINDMPAAERAAALEHMTSDFVNFVDVAEIGVSPRQYYAYKAAIKEVDDNGSISQAECARALLMTNMTNRQKADMWAFKNSTASPDKNPFNGALARRHIPPAETVEIMEEFKRIEKYMDKYRYEDGAPGKSTVQATYFIDWLRRRGYSDAEVQAIYDVFPVWSAHRVQKPTAASTEYVKANPRR